MHRLIRERSPGRLQGGETRRNSIRVREADQKIELGQIGVHEQPPLNGPVTFVTRAGTGMCIGVFLYPVTAQGQGCVFHRQRFGIIGFEQMVQFSQDIRG